MLARIAITLRQIKHIACVIRFSAQRRFKCFCIAQIFVVCTTAAAEPSRFHVIRAVDASFARAHLRAARILVQHAFVFPVAIDAKYLLPPIRKIAAVTQEVRVFRKGCEI